MEVDVDGAFKDGPRDGRDEGVTEPLSESSAVGAEGETLRPALLLRGSVIIGGGVSRELTSPMASIAPPSISVKSFMVADDAEPVREEILSSLPDPVSS